MGQENVKPSMHLPFAIDKASGRGLVDQTVVGLRRAILDGRYAANEVLPTQEEMAAALGVSVRVTREALAALAEDGLVCARGRRGTVVLPLGRRKWKGRIVYVHSPYVGSYFFSRFGETLSGELMSAGWLFTTVVLPLPDDVPGSAPPRASRAQIDAFIAAQCYDADLLLVQGCLDYAAADIDACGVPWIALMSRAEACDGFANCKGVAPAARLRSTSEFAAHCRRAGVKSVVGMNLRPQPDLEAAMKRSGVCYESWIVEPYDRNVLDSYPQSAMQAVMDRYRKSPRNLPDVLVFTDDYLARGGLTALLSLGIRVPEDVRVATFANKGYAPTFPISLACFQADPVGWGETAARSVLAYLRDGAIPNDLVVGTEYICGESFPST